MEILGRRRRITYLQIVFRAELKVAFQTSRRMLRPLAFETVRQKHHQAAAFFPFIFRCRNVLVDYYLSSIRKIAELSFPNNQVALANDRISVFETEHAAFRKRAVVNIETRLRVVAAA